MKKEKKVLSVVLIAAVTVEVYFNSLFNSFVYDDPFQILTNPWLSSFKKIPEIFSSNVWGFSGVQTNYYRPLMHVIYLITAQVFGLSPFGFHLVNLVFHTGVSVLVFLVGVKLFEKEGAINERPFFLHPAFIAAAVFSVHPVHTEAVAWVAGIPDLSCSFFFLASFYFFIRDREKEKPAFLLLSAAAFFLALLSKEPAVTLPVILLVYLLVEGGKKNPADYVKIFIPYIAVLIVYLFMRFNALKGYVPEERHLEGNNLINVFPAFEKYLQKLTFPFNLSVCYGYNPLKGVLDPHMAVPVLATLGFLLTGLYLMKKNRRAVLPLSLLVLPLLPALYIPALGQSGVFAERYLYLPSVGFVYLLSLFLHHGFKKTNVPTLALVLVSVIALFSVATVQRNNVWKNNYTLWADTIKKAPGEALPHYNLGNVFLSEGKLEEAADQYKAVIRINPGHADALNNLGIIYAEKGMLEKASENFEAAIKIDPAKKSYRNNLDRVRKGAT